MQLIVIAIVVAAIVFGPLGLIWALNTLFPLVIPYTWATWAAALILGGLFTGSVKK